MNEQKRNLIWALANISCIMGFSYLAITTFQLMSSTHIVKAMVFNSGIGLVLEFIGFVTLSILKHIK